ncbi:SWIM zinc finger family protein [Nonomuraea sp. LP-02]|uniref:SWIM zinc finger family protein n=1 Tax=Nonomuraea sp. LP-02 TaxID=3097960 RepID=UPI002E34D2B7|nr:SWIM zinc finger family protein [Nonomuraea sp. LP-02]MED7922968.1 SWIM zinc finger family protein [Nonomuraea sp. LP-02]
MIERWSRDQVLALAPDAASGKAAQGVASPGKWQVRGVAGVLLYGACRGSGAEPYLACVDLSEPAYRCTCPSRKFPCKHALGLLLLWAGDGVPEGDPAPGWAAEWLATRTARATPTRPPTGPEPGAERQPAGAGPERRAAGAESVRHGRVGAGLAEVERWLADQVRQGLAGAAEHEWDGLAKRLIDAQAPGVAGLVSRLAQVRAGDDWPGRLLAEYALINLLAVAYRRRAELPAPLARTVLIRAGFPVTREEVLAGPALRDHWDVLGRRDEVQDRLTARRVWLRGRRSGRAALVLSFAPQGQPLDASLVTGVTIDADVAFYPGAAPLRALVADRHGTVPAAGPPPGGPPEEALEEVARAVAEDPWVESWPVVLADVVPERSAIGGLPLHPAARDPWRLLAVSGGHPLTVAAEWTPRGLRPLTTWDDDGAAVIL